MYGWVSIETLKSLKIDILCFFTGWVRGVLMLPPICLRLTEPSKMATPPEHLMNVSGMSSWKKVQSDRNEMKKSPCCTISQPTSLTLTSLNCSTKNLYPTMSVLSLPVFLQQHLRSSQLFLLGLNGFILHLPFWLPLQSAPQSKTKKVPCLLPATMCVLYHPR